MTIEVTAKKVDDAINQGLKQLGVGIDDVTVEVVESGGLFRKAKVRLTLDDKPESAAPSEEKSGKAKPDKPAEKKAAEKPTRRPDAELQKAPLADKQDRPAKKTEKPHNKKPIAAEVASDNVAPENETKERTMRPEDIAAAERAVEFVKDVIAKMGFDTATVESENREKINISAPSGDDSLIIGRHGETLTALGYLAETLARAEKCHVNVTVDCNGYRDRRASSLAAMARRRANECASKHRKIKLEPMERIDRRTVHNALTGDDRVTTASEGKEPKRYVVIIPR